MKFFVREKIKEEQMSLKERKEETKPYFLYFLAKWENGSIMWKNSWRWSWSFGEFPLVKIEFGKTIQEEPAISGEISLFGIGLRLFHRFQKTKEEPTEVMIDGTTKEIPQGDIILEESKQ